MGLVDKINEFHEKYIFPLSNGFLSPYMGMSAIKNYRRQLERARVMDQGTGIGECTKTRMGT